MSTKVSELAEQLKSDDLTQRRVAAGQLARISENEPERVADELPALRRGLVDDDQEISEYTGNVLINIATSNPGRLIDSATLERLQYTLKAGNQWVQCNAAIIFSELARTNPEVCVDFVPDVVRMCRSDHEATRYYSVVFLVRMAATQPDAVYEVVDEISYVLARGDEDGGDLAFKILGLVGRRYPEIISEFEDWFAKEAESERKDRRLFVAGAIREIVSSDSNHITAFVDPVRRLIQDTSSKIREIALEIVEAAVSGDGAHPSVVEELLAPLESAADRQQIPLNRVDAIRSSIGMGNAA